MAHTIRAYASPDIAPNTIATRLDVDKDRYQRVLEEQDTAPTVRPADDITGRPEHLFVYLRFDDSETLSEIETIVEDGVLYENEWVAVDVHDCDHDRDDDNPGCGDWSRAVDRGPVPDEI